VATLDDAGRFQDAHQVMAYLGLVPSEKSSGERQHRGRITKAGSPRVRWLLVEAAWRVLRSRDPDAAPLQAWAGRVALRRGKRVAVVALARRLAACCTSCGATARTTARRASGPGGGRRLTARRGPAEQVTDDGSGERDAADGRARGRSSDGRLPAPASPPCAGVPARHPRARTED
jgi:hypothetical protein